MAVADRFLWGEGEIAIEPAPEDSPEAGQARLSRWAAFLLQFPPLSQLDPRRRLAFAKAVSAASSELDLAPEWRELMAAAEKAARAQAGE